MHYLAFVEWLAQLKELTPEQRRRLVRYLKVREPVPATPATALPPIPTACSYCGTADQRFGSWG